MKKEIMVIGGISIVNLATIIWIWYTQPVYPPKTDDFLGRVYQDSVAIGKPEEGESIKLRDLRQNFVIMSSQIKNTKTIARIEMDWQRRHAGRLQALSITNCFLWGAFGIYILRRDKTG